MNTAFQKFQTAQVSCVAALCEVAKETPGILKAMGYDNKEVDKLKDLDITTILKLNTLETPVLSIDSKKAFFERIIPLLEKDERDFAVSIQSATFLGG